MSGLGPVGHMFTDPTNPGAMLALVVDDAGTPTVEHLPCGTGADVTVELDAWYCPACSRRGRVAGSWVVSIVRAVGAGHPSTGPVRGGRGWAPGGS